MWAVHALYAQEPYHFTIGTNALSGADIYGIIQDRQGNYWLVTDNSIFKYDGYTFRQYLHPEMMSNSLFNVKEDVNGSIYCNNLNGQIFKVENDSMQLVHSVPDSLLTPYIGYNFLEGNQMVIKGRAIYKLQQDSIDILFSKSGIEQFNTEMLPDGNGRLVMQYSHDSVYFISANGYYGKKLEIPKRLGRRPILSFFYDDDGLIVNDVGFRLLSLKAESDSEMKLEVMFESFDPMGRLYHTSDNIWVASANLGIRSYPKTARTDSQSKQRIFLNYYITYLYEDRKGNILLGTKGDGLIIIPAVESYSVVDNEIIKVSKISQSAANGLFLGGYDGSVSEYVNGQIISLKQSGSKLIEIIEYFEKESVLYYNLEKSFWMDLDQKSVYSVGLGSVKDITRIDEDHYFLATNNSAVVVNTNTNEINYMKMGRSYAVGYCNEKFLLASTSGLFIGNNKAEFEELKFQDEKVLSRDIEIYQNRPFFASKNSGVLTIENGKLESIINPAHGLNSENVKQLIIYKDLIYVSTDQGFQVFDMSGNLKKTLTLSDGVPSLIVKDFVVDDENIWFLLPTGVQKISLSSFFKPSKGSQIQSIQVFVNDQLSSLEKLKSLRYDENKIRFSIYAPSLDKQQDITYQYLLRGIDETVSEQPYHQNTVEYQSLPPGDYQFEIDLLYKGDFQDRKSILLTIGYPFWLTWWFGIAVLLFIGFIFYIIFRFRLKAQEKRATEVNELNASKLTAIQSQMNPHFIFNAINSIQEYIMLNEKKLARKYLGKFADLMRIYLNHSRLSNITLREELDALALYLELEKLRFDDSLEYAIDLDDAVDADMISIPSFLIQPYVENALKHGLFHKNTDRKLLVEVQYVVYEQVLEVIIEDNGVGRKKSKEINMMRQKNHRSFATNATHRRLKLLNDRNEHHIGEQIIDLYDKEGLALGTRVTLTIPVVEHLV